MQHPHFSSSMSAFEEKNCSNESLRLAAIRWPGHQIIGCQTRQNQRVSCTSLARGLLGSRRPSLVRSRCAQRTIGSNFMNEAETQRQKEIQQAEELLFAGPQ